MNCRFHHIPGLSVLFWLVAGLLLVSPANVQAQDYGDLRKEINNKQKQTRSEIEDLNQQINNYQQRINKTEKKYDQLYRQTQDLQKVIKLQNKKIEKLEQEQQHFEDEIAVTENAYQDYEYKHKLLLKNYKESLSYLYKNGRSSELALLMTSRSINQMLIRSFYLSRFESRRQQQAKKIEKAQKELKNLKEQLVDSRQKKTELLEEIRREKQNHAQKQQKLERNIAILKQNREKIEQKLEEVRTQKQQLSQTLTRLINEEKRIRNEQRRQRESSSDRTRTTENEESVSTRSASYVSNERLERIESSFAELKGEIPWPVDNGVITERFGRRTDPVLGTQTMNLGIDISVEPKSKVRVVHAGEVFAVRPLPGYGDLVFVNHGRFKTVYGNLSKVNVRRNTFLQQGDVVGLSGTENSPKGETVFFMMRENSTDLNPANWLSER